MFTRKTLLSPVTVAGVGLHSGATSTVRISPSRGRRGIRVSRMGGILQPLSTVEVLSTERCTRLRLSDGRTVDTVEHLMAAIAILGITDCDIEFSAPEAPILDGSSIEWLSAFRSCGIVDLLAEADILVVTRAFEFETRGARYSAVPGNLRYDVSIDFSDTVIGYQSVSVAAGELETLASCRTFAMEHEIAALRAHGLALGGGLHNAVVIGASGPLNEEGFRVPDECVRHKALDLVGDLHLLGAPIVGRITASRPGHTANSEFLKAMVAEGVVSAVSRQAIAA